MNVNLFVLLFIPRFVVYLSGVVEWRGGVGGREREKMLHVFLTWHAVSSSLPYLFFVCSFYFVNVWKLLKIFGSVQESLERLSYRYNHLAILGDGKLRNMHWQISLFTWQEGWKSAKMMKWRHLLYIECAVGRTITITRENYFEQYATQVRERIEIRFAKK